MSAKDGSVKTIPEWLAELGWEIRELAERSGLEVRVVMAISENRYTTSPKQRERLADALGVAVEKIRWGSAVEVDHMYGHGPQFGRSP